MTGRDSFMSKVENAFNRPKHQKKETTLLQVLGADLKLRNINQETMGEKQLIFIHSASCPTLLSMKFDISKVKTIRYISVTGKQHWFKIKVVYCS